ncbi:hypothetical protein RZ517_03420 [Roseovarius sp. S88]|uniref:Uncharacterized protein n=1 Tax=Roseovarius phycicola TaxID=3080976 RepID=A0ABZ2HM52_9RHOB|nr:hypothetical protein [Roseovarius sp. W115]
MQIAAGPNGIPIQSDKGLPCVFIEGRLGGGVDDAVFKEAAEIRLIFGEDRAKLIMRLQNTKRTWGLLRPCQTSEAEEEKESFDKNCIHKGNFGYKI